MPQRPSTKKKITQKLEITYEFHPTARCKQEHWMYCEVSGVDPEQCRENAKKYYEKQIRELGWGRITTLKSIGPLRQTHDKAPHRTNPDLSGGRESSKSSASDTKSTSRKSRRAAGKATGGTRKGSKSSTRAKKSK